MKKNKKTNKIIFLLFLFLAFSILGWLWEFVYEIFDLGIVANHGVLFGPWLPIYGTVGLLMYVILYNYKKNPATIFMGTFVFCTAIEYVTSWYLETFKNDKWWDYSELPLNINGRVCVLVSVFFGILGLISVYLLIPRLEKFYKKINFKKASIIIVLLFSIFVIDAVNSIEHPNHVTKYKIMEIQSMDNK